MSERNTLAQRIADAREIKGASLEQMAHMTGVTTETFRGWEVGASEPRPSKMQMLAGVLGVSMSWLLAGDADHEPHEEPRDHLERLEYKIERMAHLQAELSRLSAEIADEVTVIREEKSGDAELVA